ncbi:MAG: hypothetical protein ACP6IS_05935 [Candidatus Asgardarchaeia archaeon]
MQAYNVIEDGTLSEIKLSKDELKPDRVIIVVDDANERIYIWQGASANVRKKFIASRQALNIRARKGMNYRVYPITQGDESVDFFQLVEGKVSTTPTPKAKKVVPPPTPPPPTPSIPSPPKERTTAKPSSPHVSVSTPTPSKSYKPSIGPVTKPTEKPTLPSAPVSSSARSLSATSATVSKPQRATDVSSILKSLDAIDVPAGFRREMVIVGDTIFTITEKRRRFFGETTVERTIEPISAPPDGEFYVEDYKIRVIVRNNKVYAIEFLRPESPEVILEEIEPTAKKHISELIDVFEELKKKKK